MDFVMKSAVMGLISAHTNEMMVTLYPAMVAMRIEIKRRRKKTSPRLYPDWKLPTQPM